MESNHFFDLVKKYNYTFSHVSSGLTDENSPLVTNNVRVYRDITTDAFVKNIFHDEETRFLFLDYTFHIINSMLCSKINDYLLDNKCPPLYGDEKIYFVFKGGNVMNYFMQLYLKSIEEIFNNVELVYVQQKYSNPNILPYVDSDNIEDTSTFESFFANLKENFKVSDVDYSVYIKASSSARFILIHGGIIRILAATLAIIAEQFEAILENTNINIDMADIPDTTDDINDDFSYAEQYQKLKILISNEKYFEFIGIINDKISDLVEENRWRNFVENLDEDDRSYYEDLVNAITEAIGFIADITVKSSSITNFTKIYDLVATIEYLQTIYYLGINNTGYNLDQDNVASLKKKLNMYLWRLLNKKLYHVCNNHIYTLEKLQNIRVDVVNGFEKLIGQPKYDLVSDHTKNIWKKYVVVNKPKLEDVVFEKRANSIMKCDNDPVNQHSTVNSQDKLIHYITFNNMVHIAHKGIIINFDLMRIKFSTNLIGSNVLVNGKDQPIKIPSEFIDVSVPFFGDTARELFLENKQQHTTKIDLRNQNIGRNIVIQSYGLNDLIHDLQYVLFKQNHFIPWLDPKYNKRITRILFIGILDAYQDDCSGGVCVPNKMKTRRDMLDFFNTVLEYSTKIFDGDNVEYPYFEAAKFIRSTHKSIEHIQGIVDDIQTKYLDLLPTQLISIKKEYEDIDSLVKFIIIYSRFLTFDNETKYQFINKYRTEYSYVPVERENFGAYMDNFNTKFMDLLKLFVNVGYKILFIFEELLNYRRIYRRKLNKY